MYKATAEQSIEKVEPNQTKFSYSHYVQIRQRPICKQNKASKSTLAKRGREGGGRKPEEEVNINGSQIRI